MGGGADCRLVITKLQLIVPRMTFNVLGNDLYQETYTKTRQWTYLRENIQNSNATRQQSGNFRISTGVYRPRHVFVFITNEANNESQLANKFLYNTFTVANQTLNSCHLEVGNGIEYPNVQYKPKTEPSRVFRDVLNYINANSEYEVDNVLNLPNFKDLFSLIYFDLTKQPLDVKDGMTKLVFKYSLSGATNADYSMYALVLYEQDVENNNVDGKLILRSKSTM